MLFWFPQVRIEQVIVAEPGAVLLYKLSNLLKFYHHTIRYLTVIRRKTKFSTNFQSLFYSCLVIWCIFCFSHYLKIELFPGQMHYYFLSCRAQQPEMTLLINHKCSSYWPLCVFFQLHHWNQCGLSAYDNRGNAHPQQKYVF